MTDSKRPLLHKRRTLQTLAALSAAGLGASRSAHAQTYPDRPIRMVIAYSAGGATDVTARAMAPFIEKYLGGGARLVVENRTGAGGGIGFAQLAAAPADGYTVGFINTPNVLTIPIERKSPFHWDQYDLIGNVVDDPGNFSVHADSPIRNLDQLAAFAKSRPGQVTVGTTGVGSDDHLAMLYFEKIAGVRMNHVPFKGAADVRAATLGKQIDVAAVNIGEAMQAIKAGSPLRNLGQMCPTRTELAPDVPTFKEQGYNIEMSSLRGIAAPKGLPAEVRERWVRAVAQTCTDPEFLKINTGLFTQMRYLAPAAYRTVLRDTEAQFRQLWTEMPWGDK